ncbi:uncharacterized protein LOC113317520 [Papaver somniferum]|uniref:uncharacterized protein LOC113317520 n=1 Tax=Papaver somniferum TaxID=3469 RepID=UPI000E6FC1DA|nr:uncharacterized protein LOC113317520 [Papaver somniferum]XP_026421430.1 uncharacterized protein LOC113317520 [Papaver somniferum]XP_026421431.1 uncharacterized protein LOC113317520 [Papaver somniferum]
MSMRKDYYSFCSLFPPLSFFFLFLWQQELKMFGSICCQVRANLKRAATSSNGHPFSSTANRYFLFTLQNPDVLIKARVSSMFCSLSTASNNINSSSSDSSFVVGYLINSCGLSKNEALSVSKKIKLKPTSQPDSVVELFESYGFTKPHISKLITKHPSVLLSDPCKTLKPKLDFFKSKGLDGIELPNFILTYPRVLRPSLKGAMIPSFDIFKSIVHTNTDTIKILGRCTSWILGIYQLKKLMVNIELLRCEGVPPSNICKSLIRKPSGFIGDADKFKEIVEKVKRMGFNPLRTTFTIAIEGLVSMSEATWKMKLDAYKSWGWSEDQIQTAFRKGPHCMMASENKITAIMDFLVNEMGYDSSSIAETPVIFNNSLKERIIPRCSVIRILVSKGLIEGTIPLNVLSVMTDKSFSEKFVKPYEQEAPALMKVFQGQLSYQELLLK